MQLCDAHTHLDGYRANEVEGILSRARTVGVALIIAAGVTEASSAACVALAARYAPVFAGVGIHPMDLRGPVDEATYGRLRDLARSSPKVVVVSEVGLDFAQGAPDLALQYQALREQVRLARELRLPVVFHSRELAGEERCHHEVLRVLREERAWEVGGAMHYFQADGGVARACMDLGFFISLAKPLLRLPHLQELAKELPMDSLVLETDSYPQYFKGDRARWTEPRDVHRVATRLAELKGMTAEEVAAATTANLVRMLRRAPQELGLAGNGVGS